MQQADGRGAAAQNRGRRGSLGFQARNVSREVLHLARELPLMSVGAMKKRATDRGGYRDKGDRAQGRPEAEFPS